MAMYRMHPMRWVMMGWWGGGWMIGAMVLGFILVCFLVMTALRFTAWGPRRHHMGYGMGGSPDAEEILRQRYARGEVTGEQYDQILHALREGRS